MTAAMLADPAGRALVAAIHTRKQGADMTDRLAQIQARALAATPGPWFQHQDWIDMGVPDASHTITDDPKSYGGKFIASVGLHYDVKHGNAEFIAHAPEDVAHLLAMVRELQGRVDAVVRQVEVWEAYESPGKDLASNVSNAAFGIASRRIRAAITATEGAE